MSIDSVTKTQHGTNANPAQYKIEANVPYGQDNIFYRLSGGSTLQLCTVNEDAAQQLEVGKKIRVTIEVIE